MKIYVASSWRNGRQPYVVDLLREWDHEVYDFRNPKPGDSGFHWSEIDPKWKLWSPQDFRDGLAHPLAQEGFSKDLEAMKWANAFVLVLPCGKSAHLELGWAIGARKPSIILIENASEPELMYKMATSICTSLDELKETLEAL